jgi:hypothetical protein
VQAAPSIGKCLQLGKQHELALAARQRYLALHDKLDRWTPEFVTHDFGGKSGGQNPQFVKPSLGRAFGVGLTQRLQVRKGEVCAPDITSIKTKEVGFCHLIVAKLIILGIIVNFSRKVARMMKKI